MSAQQYLIRWKSNIAKLSFMTISFDRLVQQMPLAKKIQFSESPFSEPSNDLEMEQYDDDSEIANQIAQMRLVSGKTDRVDDENVMDEEAFYDEEDYGGIEDQEISERERPWFSRLRDITSRPRERMTIGEEKIISPTPTKMEEKDVPIILTTKLPVALPRNPTLIPRPEFLFE